jgi:hypothetical protein
VSNRIRQEVLTLVIALSVTLIAFWLLAIFRFFDSKTFLFIQILILSVLLLFSLYIYAVKRQDRLSQALRGRELISVLVMFTILAFSLLNIDRSRSVYLLKWISITEKSNVTSQEFISSHSNSELDVRDLTQRLNEQEALKSITISKDRINLTVFGRFIINASYLIAKFQNLKGFKAN